MPFDEQTKVDTFFIGLLILDGSVDITSILLVGDKNFMFFIGTNVTFLMYRTQILLKILNYNAMHSTV